MKKNSNVVNTMLALLLLFTFVSADDISLGSIGQCKGFGGKYRVTKAVCDNCNWGEEATFYGKVNADSCSDLCVVATASAALGIGGEQEVFREDNYDCSSSFETSVKFPAGLPKALEHVASGTLKVEFFEGGCDGTRVGCSKIPLSGISVGVRLGAAVALAGCAAAMTSFAVYKRRRQQSSQRSPSSPVYNDDGHGDVGFELMTGDATMA
eukprot:CAMPEP_0194255548 /NCGR_PEP_ID=MMETSP0158-20130606/34677_1 /TAXON_ID=33649 /ORGANISM="Thalassionema nitzschioides, Strain L26-B" /LENGTH=209 /DNA_ID=CAMNT_0038993929 /DNA_START=94 /DNA_END=723 /DNA_ORIENTATION=+